MADDDTILNQSGSGDDSPTDDSLKQGPSFEAFFSGSCITRRLSGRSYQADRVANNSYRAGWAGYFGRNQATYDGGPTTGWRVMGLSLLTSSAAVNVSPSNSSASNGPLGSIRTGTTWDYSGGPAVLRKNGSGTGSIISPTFDNPNIGNRIIANNHTYSTGGYYLNVKYATVATGQDYASNYLSNRLLLA